jgi:cellulose synthase/poly-beta-1,6-N-acetylglucosamine synthase-like glycosyltransferase
MTTAEIMLVVSAVLLIVGIYLSGYVSYWIVLLVTHLLSPGRRLAPGPLSTRFAVVVPAHNEELLVGRLLDSIRHQDYPPKLFDAIVVADNCTDATAVISRSHDATVLERMDERNRGKGYAIKWALETIDLDRYDAVLIVDADCTISASSLRSLDAMLQGWSVIQCYNGVGNPDNSWFTRLLDVSRTVNNRIYSPAKQRLGLSCELTGTGMCFATRILRKHGWDAFTVGEDWEYYAKLIGKGEIVGFDMNARVYHEESSSLRQATSQRMRWSSGRFAVARKYGLGLLSMGLIERNLIKFDAGLSLILPNPSLGMNVTLLCLCGAFLAIPGHRTAFASWFLVLALAQLGVFMVGVVYTQNRLSKFLAIFIAPVFLVWKLGIDALSILGVGRRRWVRTQRKP